ncbi:ecdysone 20-monooxygenase [Scaptodrosophila lebanonensis]|uniref:Ecdysone 20-monooxygenase n=1 Tax=Drosophila lebanonensis TaxID=7225 RepID=A0A6J2UC10_DROLE|nr:ecdysone 20-monooxygenase [Scaptodrosophila lebanonensis]
MVMAVILLIALALVLCCYCAINRQKINAIYLKPLLKKTRQLTNNTANDNADVNGNANANDCYHATPIQGRQRRTIWDIPGPQRIPFLGTKWIFLVFFRRYKMTKLHEVYADLNRQYGDIVLEVMPSNVPIVHLYNRDDLERVLKYPSKYPFRPPTEIIVMYRQSRPDRYASLGIVNEQGPTWQKLRSSLTSSITSPRILQNFLPALNAVCDDFIELLRARRDPQSQAVHNFEELANLMGLEAVCTLMLGRRMGFLAPNTKQPHKISQLAAAVKQLFISQRDSYYGLGLWKYFPTKTYRDFARAEDLIYDIISEIIDNELEQHKNTAACEDEDAAGLRSVFLNILELKDLDIRDKKSAIIDFIAAGIETLANTLLFVLSSVTSEPQAKLRILDEFCEYRHTNILQDALTNATYTKACIQESYRLRPTAFCLARILEEDMELSGYSLNAGTVVLCQNMIACHKDRNFHEAKQFSPERWIDASGNFTVNVDSASIVVPFGVGRRTCPGKRFVEMEVVLLLAKLVLAFDVDFVEPLQTEFEFLLAPKTPLSLVLRDRTF